jgi:hypothetical protein
VPRTDPHPHVRDGLSIDGEHVEKR